MLTLAFEKLHRELILVSPDQRHFMGARTGRRFTPLGFNYDHDEHYRLIEDYWHEEWDKVVADMTAMRELGANVIRIHLQLAKFIQTPWQENIRELEQLDRLVELADSLGLYLDLVGLACFHSWDVPDWYQRMDYPERWQQQAFFWEILAKRYVGEPTIFCFDLMNEPVVSGKRRPEGAWLGKDHFGKCYIQFITLGSDGVAKVEVALAWIRTLKDAIRRHDSQRLITVGLVDWSLPGSVMKSGFFPKRIVQEVDFISTHLYPEAGKIPDMIKTLRGFCVGKPVLIDETFQLKCSIDEHIDFLQKAAQYAQGFISFYTDFLADNIDNGRNVKLCDAQKIFQQVMPHFQKKL